MPDIPEEAVEAAKVAGETYLQNCEDHRRAESRRIFKHDGAHIPAAYPDWDQRRTLELKAAEPALRQQRDDELRDRLTNAHFLERLRQSVFTHQSRPAPSQRDELFSLIDAVFEEADGG